MYWDGEQQTYLPAPQDDQDALETQPEGKKGKDKDKKEKVKVAKKIAKDMEKWAKTLNAQKEAMKEGFKKSFQPLSHEYKESASADAGFAILEKRALTDRKPTLDVFKKDEPKNLMPPPSLVSAFHCKAYEVAYDYFINMFNTYRHVVFSYLFMNYC